MSNSTTKYYEVSITPASSGFGEYQCTSNGEGWVDDGDLLSEIAQNSDGEIIELCDGAELSDGAEDIRGRIHNEPRRVFALVRDDGEIGYFGIAHASA